MAFWDTASTADVPVLLRCWDQEVAEESSNRPVSAPARSALEKTENHNPNFLHFSHRVNPSLHEAVFTFSFADTAKIRHAKSCTYGCWPAPIFFNLWDQNTAEKCSLFPWKSNRIISFFFMRSHKLFFFPLLFCICHMSVRRIIFLLTEGILSKLPLCSLLTRRWPEKTF